MFAPGQEQLSKEQIRAGEQEAKQTIHAAITGGILLYLCELTWIYLIYFLSRIWGTVC
ncbi:mitochondrial import receptor subunit OR translocase-domain-containing protein [Aspergillus alliaceus]|uniref:Mitochondrial import receptor subunit OR translocase-domain-containing protein n=1 Tax=Petromyces alliaceus TaxID=209559 RepID=A0A5N7CD45_PETAA|nr:mitochondrial import receptor subunit OR translocase-domain-containing protein [Aspergillus alliaceus]